jgi:hypothetical protein
MVPNSIGFLDPTLKRVEVIAVVKVDVEATRVRFGLARFPVSLPTTSAMQGHRPQRFFDIHVKISDFFFFLSPIVHIIFL